MENSSFISDAEWTDYINEAGSELHDLLVSKFGDDYFLSSTSVSVVAGTDSYSLPTDFMKIRGVDAVVGSQNVTLRHFEFEERNKFQLYTGQLSYSLSDLMYRVQGTTIKLVPVPADAGTLTVWYVPQYTLLSADGDLVDSQLAQGWDSYIVVDAAMKALAKEESDTAQLQAEKAAVIARIESAAANRDISEPFRCLDMRLGDFDGCG